MKHLEEIREAGLETPSVNQIELHPFCQQKEIVDYCNEHDIFVQAYCPLVRGKFDNPVLQEVARNHKKDVAQVLVRWSLQRGYVRCDCVSSRCQLNACCVLQIQPPTEVVPTYTRGVERESVRLGDIG